VQRGDELLVVAVATEDQCVLDEDGRAAVAVNRLVFQVGVPPEHLAAEVETGGPLVAEVDEEPLAADPRRRAGVAVLCPGAWGGGAGPGEDPPGPEHPAPAGVPAQRPPRLVAPPSP